MRILGLLLTMTMWFSPAKAQFGKLLDQAKKVVTSDDTSIDVSAGLKEALDLGVTEAVETLSAKDGYLESPYKILIPEEADKIVTSVSKVPGFTNVKKDLVLKMNEAAELAAKKATPIFVAAIKEMSFADATDILMGEQDAATRYLERTSGKQLYSAFMPIIQAALDEVNARDIWTKAVSTYNSIPFQKKLNPELDDHVNQMALKGLFSLIQEKEEDIREDVGLRTSPLLKEVFARQDK